MSGAASVPPGAAREPWRGRLRALDGLRGLAALVVLLHHVLLASAPQLAAAYDGGLPPRGTVGWLLTYTPLHIVWAGPEAVVVFFVLSGFVLSLPVARGGWLRLGSYYPGRLLRLYLPVWGALAIAAALHLAVSHHAVPGASWWLNRHSQPLEVRAARRDAALLPGAGDWGFTSVLWSLRWEVLFSLLLPLLLLAPLRARSWSALGGLLCFVALLRAGDSVSAGVTRLGAGGSLLGSSGGEYMLELPPFLLGVLLAFRHEQIERLAAVLRARTARSIAAKLALGVACIGGLTADWWLPGSGDPAGLVAAGACLALVGALSIGAFGDFLESPPMQWTGRRSYSLYLVHEPIVVALAFAAGGRPSPVLFALVAIPLALTAASAFFRLVESPSHRLARRWVSYRAAAAVPTGGATPGRPMVGIESQWRAEEALALQAGGLSSGRV
jgi:peptidoglycan/LPS O-acetylase OafA/YrhL